MRDTMHNFIVLAMSKFGYSGVFFLILVENIFPPIPSEVILLLGGIMCMNLNLNIYLMIISSTLGSLFGAILLYYLGFILNKNRLKKIVNSKAGKILCLRESDIDYSCDWFDKKGISSLFFCRFIPIVRSLISIPAGICKVSFKKFLTLTMFGSLIWNSVLIYLGSILGKNYYIVLRVLEKYKRIVIVLGSLLILVLIYKKIKKNKNIE